MKDFCLESFFFGYVYKNVDSFICRVFIMGFIGENRDRVSIMYLWYNVYCCLINLLILFY